MKLVWEKTGDFIEIDNLNEEFSYFCFEQWKVKSSNKFFVYKDFIANQIFDELKKSLEYTNKNLEFFNLNNLKLPISFQQNELNSLHEEWVILQRKHPMISYLCEKKFKDGKFHFDNINEKIHELEDIFEILLTNNDKNPIVNKFNYNLTSFDSVNVYLQYKNPGRMSFDKWLHFDESLDNVDRNDFREFFGYINVNLNRPFKKTLPNEYVEWCKNKGIESYYGDKIILGNFKNLDKNLNLYRNLFVKNFSDKENSVIFVK